MHIFGQKIFFLTALSRETKNYEKLKIQAIQDPLKKTFFGFRLSALGQNRDLTVRTPQQKGQNQLVYSVTQEACCGQFEFTC